MDKQTAATHYGEHAGKPFYDGLIEYITRSPVLHMAVGGPAGTWQVVRRTIGATNPAEADPGTIRGDLALTTEKTWSTAPTAPNRPAGRWRCSSPTSRPGDLRYSFSKPRPTLAVTTTRRFGSASSRAPVSGLRWRRRPAALALVGPAAPRRHPQRARQTFLIIQAGSCSGPRDRQHPCLPAGARHRPERALRRRHRRPRRPPVGRGPRGQEDDRPHAGPHPGRPPAARRRHRQLRDLREDAGLLHPAGSTRAGCPSRKW